MRPSVKHAGITESKENKELKAALADAVKAIDKAAVPPCRACGRVLCTLH